MTHDYTIPDNTPYLSATDLAALDRTMRFFPATSVADHAISCFHSEYVPQPSHDVMESIERFHVREYQRLFVERMAEMKPLPVLIAGSGLSDMVHRQMARLRDYEEAMILSMFHDIPPQPQPFNWPAWDAKPLTGKELTSVIFDDYDFAIDPTPKWTEALAGLQSEGKTLTNFMAAAKAIMDAIPPTYTPPPRPIDNRAARRAERAKKRKTHA